MMWFIIGALIGIGAGWYLKGRYGAKVAEVKDAVL